MPERISLACLARASRETQPLDQPDPEKYLALHAIHKNGACARKSLDRMPWYYDPRRPQPRNEDAADAVIDLAAQYGRNISTVPRVQQETPQLLEEEFL